VETVSFEDFKKIDLRVARIVEALPHPNADKLVVLKLDVGDGQSKQIVAGIRAFYTDEQLVGKTIIIVNNLAPVLLRGVESNGMLLATRNGGDVILLAPEKPADPGSAVS
jgi:methionyl-tRNA synthetase